MEENWKHESKHVLRQKQFNYYIIATIFIVVVLTKRKITNRNKTQEKQVKQTHPITHFQPANAQTVPSTSLANFPPGLYAVH